MGVEMNTNEIRHEIQGKLSGLATRTVTSLGEYKVKKKREKEERLDELIIARVSHLLE